jgi:hypothetical protein
MFFFIMAWVGAFVPRRQIGLFCTYPSGEITNSAAEQNGGYFVAVVSTLITLRIPAAQGRRVQRCGLIGG